MIWLNTSCLILFLFYVYSSNIVIVVDGIAISAVDSPDDITGVNNDDDDDDDDAEALFNKTYSEQTTELEREVFRKYNVRTRPTKNGSAATVIDVHWHIIHASINQEQGSMTLHGHLYMRWDDDYLGWDPDDFNGIRLLQARKWHVWNPRIRVANSISGVHSHHDIAPVAHVLIMTQSKEKGSSVEMYPTFSINVGCYFDYADYPNDINECSIAIYSPTKLSDVALRVYESWPPTLMLGWGAQANKRIISDFEIVDFKNRLLYYRNGSTTTEKPTTPFETANTWPVIEGTVRMRRHTALYGIGIFLPCLVSILINICSFILPSLYMSIYSIMANYVIQITFLQEIVTKLPLTISKVPDTVVMYGLSMFLNLISFFFHIFFIYLATTNTTPPKSLQRFLERFTTFYKKKTCENWTECITIIRALFSIIFIFGYVIIGLYFVLN